MSEQGNGQGQPVSAEQRMAGTMAELDEMFAQAGENNLGAHGPFSEPKPPATPQGTTQGGAAPAGQNGQAPPDTTQGTTQAPSGESKPDAAESLTAEQKALLGITGNEGGKPIEIPQPLAEVMQGANIADPSGFFKTELPELRQKAEQLGTLMGNLEKLPPALNQMIEAHMSGQDWTGIARKASQFDFSKPADQLSPEQLLSAYGEETFSAEEMEEYRGDDCDPRLKTQIDRALNHARNAYKADQDGISNHGKRQAEAAEQFRKAESESLNSDIQAMVKERPTMAYFVQGGLDKQMLSEAHGPLFRKADGTFKSGAALAFVLAKNPKMVLDAIAGRAYEKGAEDSTLREIPKTPAAPRGQGGQGSGVKTTLEKLKEGLNQDFGAVANSSGRF